MEYLAPSQLDYLESIFTNALIPEYIRVIARELFNDFMTDSLKTL